MIRPKAYVGFIERNRPQIYGERAGDCYALLIAAGHVLRGAMQLRAQANGVQQHGGAFAIAGSSRAPSWRIGVIMFSDAVKS